MATAKVLIVEDEFITAHDISRQLKKLGYVVSGTVDSGELAIAKAAEMRPDVVLMDIVLQGKVNGIAAAQKIWHDYQIPIVYLTAFADPDTVQQARETQPFGYLLKPFRSEDLNVAIQVAIRRHQAEKAIRQRAEVVEQRASQYLAMASHDLRTPLALIKTGVDLLEQFGNQCQEEKKQRYFQQVKEAVKSMDGLIEDILTFGHIESGRLGYAPEVMDVAGFCQDLLAAFQTGIGQNHHLEFIQKGTCQQVFLDAKLLWHCLSNLLSNAIKYSPPQTTIELELCCPDAQPEGVMTNSVPPSTGSAGPIAPNTTVLPPSSSPASSLAGQVTFQVRDHGHGIAPEDQEHLFEPFFRAKSARKTTGTGLGLTITQACVALQQGTLTLVSEVGVGTTVCMTLPCAIPEESAAGG
ncbi:ATP-binding protein [Trichothermofontia sichuanensis B231]|uniref:hybrid sensor histidine kinase/response regulator n=1 Tax=Trichothermofontia sichuanensis TaxID=3045816 RepID=UPI002245D237|nr:ATP-binding protein [Trichothermofontia sichuanensis]UZQ53872.1 ATP-binding protein [Trichothermofontia sichuanensis B231]